MDNRYFRLEIRFSGMLLHVAYNASAVTRRERAEKLRQKKAYYQNQITPAVRQILEAIQEKDPDYGAGQFDELARLLLVPPIRGFGSS